MAWRISGVLFLIFLLLWWALPRRNATRPDGFCLTFFLSWTTLIGKVEKEERERKREKNIYDCVCDVLFLLNGALSCKELRARIATFSSRWRASVANVSIGHRKKRMCFSGSSQLSKDMSTIKVFPVVPSIGDEPLVAARLMDRLDCVCNTAAKPPNGQ